MGKSRKSRQKNSVAYDFVACLLVILSPFTNYIIYTEYSRLFPDLIIVVGLILAVAVVLTVLLQIPSSTLRAAIFSIMITIVMSEALYEFNVAEIGTMLIAMSATLLVVLALMYFLRKHTTKLIIATFLAMLCSTLVIGLLDKPGQGVSGLASTEKNGNGRPVIVHLILDEHIGLAGMTSDLPGGRNTRKALQEFYTRAGFRVFSHAYSQYANTTLSLASALNFDDNGVKPGYLARKRSRFSLNKNAYLKSVSERGYQINIYQSNYFDLCAADIKNTRKCLTYKLGAIDASEIKILPLTERVRLIANMYFSTLNIVKLVRIAEHPARGWLARRGLTLPGLRLWHGRVGPIAVAHTLDRLTKDIARSTGGELFFAHLLMPHHPYVYTPKCKVRTPISSWSLPQPEVGGNTPASRHRRYREYFDQVRCTTAKLEHLFDVMKRKGTYDDAIIIVHGDHGSKINIGKPAMNDRSSISPDYYADTFSTLFAVKAPGITPGLDTRTLGLPHLLAYTVDLDENRLSEPRRPVVYMPGSASNTNQVLLPAWPELSD